MKYKILLAYILLFYSLGLHTQTTIPALITSNQVWDISGSPYLLNQNSFIDSGVSVIVKPGVEIITSGAFKIDIDGEFQARGTWDSVIKITKVRLNFSVKSMDYNPNNGHGTFFNYCLVEGNGSGSTAFQFTNTSVKVDHSQFTNAHFSISIYAGSPYEASVTELTNSKFYGVTNFNSGSPIYCNNMKSKLRVSNCLFSNASNIYTYGNVVFTNNTFYKLSNVNFEYMYGANEISCNKFLNMSQGVTINSSDYNNGTNLNFINNTLDTIGTANQTFYNMLTLARKASNNTMVDTMVIANNNFLTYIGKGAKVVINSNNLTPTTTDIVDLKSNYWGTSDSAIIESVIKDYSDDINIYGRADFSSFLTSPVVGCSYNRSCAIANFKYTVNDTVVSFKDSSYSSSPYLVKWKFGDGTTNNSNQKTTNHSYQPGVYQVCMYTYDTLNRPCDSMCKTIHIASQNGCHASYYFAIDTTNISNIYVVNTSTGINVRTKYYWTFGDGTGSNATNPTHSYMNAGKYQLCLTIYDTVINCYSTYCDSVEIIFPNMMLIVINDIDVLKINKSGIEASLAVYPNPSKGLFKIFLNAFETNDVKIDVMSLSGQIIKSENYTTVLGRNEINLNLSDFASGLYCLNIRSGNFSKIMKVTIQK